MENFFEYVLIAIGLSMDSLAVSITSGTMIKFKMKDAFKIAIFLSFFQALMPIVGWFTGIGFSSIIREIDHWIASGLLFIIGIKMIFDALKCDKEDEKKKGNCLKTSTLIMLSLATSIDALAVGITYSILDIKIVYPVIIIGIITFIASFSGLFIGRQFKNIVKKGFENFIEILGGIILIGIGIKILFEHIYFD